MKSSSSGPPPAPWIELFILEILYYWMACIHKHLIEVSAWVGYSQSGEQRQSNPIVKWVFADLIIQI